MAGEILSSTGSLGLEYRSHDRLYLNWRGGVVGDLSRLERWAGISQIAVENGLTGPSGDITRCVGRFLIDASDFEELYRFPKLTADIEAAVPIGGDVFMCLFGINHRLRQPLVPVGSMVRATDRLPAGSMTPSERVMSVRTMGFRFRSDFQTSSQDGILSLWQSTFGWTPEELDHLGNRLISQKYLLPQNRSVWFTGLYAGAELVSLATAERLSLPLGNGRLVHIIESTEWRTRADAVSKGYGAATVSRLNAQVIDDMEQGHEPYVIIAETNFRSGAYRVGRGSAMSVPARKFNGFEVSQILKQNVEVGDGLDPAGKRDFVMMYLGDDAKRKYYPPPVRRAMLERGTL